MHLWDGMVSRKQGKHPRVYGGFTAATNKQKKIIKWWNEWPDSNVGIRTGIESDCFVVDEDGEEGRNSLLALETEYGKLPDTWKAKSGGGGEHKYFKHPVNIKIPCSQSRIGEKLDIKGDGGYVIAYPSRHISGNQYEWEKGFSPHDLPLAEAPEWLINLITASKKKKASEGSQAAIEGIASDGLIYKGVPGMPRFSIWPVI